MTTLVSFNGTNGGNPFAGLLEASDGNFYGTTAMGGASNNGTVFRLTPSGELSTLISFNRTNGANPHAELIEASDGNLFGTTTSGGTNGGYGTVFKMSREGLLTTVFSFNGTNGSSPVAPLIQARDGNFYGTTRDGGSVSNPYGYGTIFRLVMPVGLKSRVGANELILSWPTNAVGFTIQSSTNLNSSANWTDSTNAPVVIDGQFTITNAILGSEQFYRLKK